MTAARKPFTFIAAALFLLIALVHLYRVYSGLAVMIGTYEVPQGASWIAAVIAALLGVMLVREARG